MLHTTELDGCVDPATEAMKQNADAIFDHMITSSTHKARLDEVTLSLPLELQTVVVNYLRNYSNLKALCLASKHISDVATPRLYYELNLRNGGNGHISRMRQRINSLRIQLTNLRFV